MHNTQVINKTHNIDEYFFLLKNLSINEKLKLISKISDSITEKDVNENNFFKCFGKFQTSKNADEIINDIYSSRNFMKKDIHL